MTPRKPPQEDREANDLESAALTPTCVYVPDNELRRGFFAIFQSIATEIRKNGWLIWQLFRRDFIVQYRQSLIGFFWAVLIPLVTVGTFALLNRSGLFRLAAIPVPYPIFAVFGLMIWQIFAIGLVTCSDALVKAGSMIVKINVSKKSLLLAAFLQSAVAFLIQFALLLFLYRLFRLNPGWRSLLLPILVMPLVLLTFGLGLVFSVLNGIMRDTAKFLQVFMTFALFLTPVMYMKPSLGLLARITRFNPLYYLVCFPRNYILLGDRSDLPGYLTCSLLAVAVFILFLLVFHLAETRVSERI